MDESRGTRDHVRHDGHVQDVVRQQRHDILIVVEHGAVHQGLQSIVARCQDGNIGGIPKGRDDYVLLAEASAKLAGRKHSRPGNLPISVFSVDKLSVLFSALVSVGASCATADARLVAAMSKFFNCMISLQSNKQTTKFSLTQKPGSIPLLSADEASPLNPQRGQDVLFRTAKQHIPAPTHQDHDSSSWIAAPAHHIGQEIPPPQEV